jgi:DNA repair protein RecN (Recombination protein N)
LLKELYIQNYALIAETRLNLVDGFISVTGESGAGKTLMLGALNLISGARADFDVISRGEDKTVVEASFVSSSPELPILLEENSLDVYEQVIIRRELTRAGRSRAFVNDSPVSLSFLREVSEHLFQIHGQHENQIISKSRFQFEQIDGFVNLQLELKEFQIAYKNHLSYKHEYESLLEAAAQVKKDLDYFQFQFDELMAIGLEDSQISTIENDYNLLEHSEEILESLKNARNGLYGDSGSHAQIDQVKKVLSSIDTYSPEIKSVADRIESIHIELSDLEKDIERIADSVDVDPQKKRLLEEKLDELNKQYAKHSVSNIEELKLVLADYELKLSSIDSFGEELERLQDLTSTTEKQVRKLALSLSEARSEGLQRFNKTVNNLLEGLGMPKAHLKLELRRKDSLNQFGIDEIEILFNANDAQFLKPISDVASGGEISRLMLALKAIHSENNLNLSMIFDEIDTGVSGEVAKRMGKLMRQLSANGQIIAITHSPGVAAQGIDHIKIYKEEQGDQVVSKFVTLSEEERLIELATMFSGNQITKAALESARSLRKP